MDPYTRSVVQSFCFSFGMSIIRETHQYGAIHKTETTTKTNKQTNCVFDPVVSSHCQFMRSDLLILGILLYPQNFTHLNRDSHWLILSRVALNKIKCILIAIHLSNYTPLVISTRSKHGGKWLYRRRENWKNTNSTHAPQPSKQQFPKSSEERYRH